MIFTSRTFAIGRAHFQTAGGTRMLLILAGAYVAVASALLGILFYNETPTPMTYASLYVFVMAVEAFLLVLFGSMRIGQTIRLDVMSNMIESHRLMPVSAWRAMLGYLGGATAHVLAITVLNVILLAWLAAKRGIHFDDFVISQVVLGLFALFVWNLAATGALVLKQVMPLMIVAGVAGAIGSGIVRQFGILPGLSLLASPFLGESIFSITGGGVNLRQMYPWSLFGQAAFVVLLFAGSCRRYRGAYASTFNVGQALGLGAVWGIISVAGIETWQHLNFRWMNRQPGVRIQVVAALAVAAIFAIVPMHALAAYQKRKGLPMWAVAGGILACVGACMINLVALHWAPDTGLVEIGAMRNIVTLPPVRPDIGITFLVMLCHALTLYLAFRATRNMSAQSVAVLVVALLFAVWILPFLVELGRFMLMDISQRADTPPSALITFSPLGMLISRFTSDTPGRMIFGLAYQWLVAGGVWWLGQRLNRGEEAAVFTPVTG